MRSFAWFLLLFPLLLLLPAAAAFNAKSFRVAPAKPEPKRLMPNTRII